MNKFNNKKTIIILILLLLVGIVGVTIAYFSNTASINNLFSTKEYGTTVTEEFVSPDNWLPGDITEKTIVATNSGSVDEAVRISYTEKWVAKDGTILSGLIDSNGNLTNNTENSEHAAIINFSDNGDWNYSNGYYYYKFKLSPNNTTSTLIDSVTFNSKVKNSSNCTTVENNGIKTITCNSTNSGYDGATYTLTFKIETAQYNKYKQAWGVDVAILNEQTLFCDAFEVGEVVDYNGSEYYVLKDSSTSDDYVTLLKKEPLTAEVVNQYSTSYVSQDGEYPYYESDTCNENNQTGCSTNYDTSDVKKIMDGWSSSFSDDLVSIDGYKTRLMNDTDIFLEKYITPSSVGYHVSKDTPSFVYMTKEYWTSIQLDDSLIKILVLDLHNNDKFSQVYNNNYIRPVINLKKNILQCNCNVNDYEYKVYNIGEKIIYDNAEYYVLKNSDKNSKYVTLLRENVLTADEINLNSIYRSDNGKFSYCTPYCSSSYENSYIKIIIDNWSYKYKNDLVNMYGYKSRILGLNNEYNNLNDWVYNSNNPYWTMIHTYGNNYYVISSTLSHEEDYKSYYIRPVINLKKCAIEGNCNKNCDISYTEDNNQNEYILGKNIIYKNENYCVINNSGLSTDYVTVIKQEPLSYDELVTYNNGYEISRNNVDNDIGTISYYSSENCYYNSDSDKNLTGCLNNYNNSYVKNIVDNWSNSLSNDLKEVNGYKARLITNDELNNMGHLYINSTADPRALMSDYNCLYGDADYFTMSSSGDDSNFIDIVSKIVNNNGSEYVDKKYAVRPVINLKKCAIDGTC